MKGAEVLDIRDKETQGILEKIGRIGDEMQHASTADRSNLYYAKAKQLLLQLREMADTRYAGDGYLKEKVSTMETHLAALAELDDGSIHGKSQDLSSLSGAITGFSMQVRDWENRNPVE